MCKKYLFIMLFLLPLFSLPAQSKNQVITVDTIRGYYIDEYEFCKEKFYVYSSSYIIENNTNKTRFYSNRSLNIDNINKIADIIPKVNRQYNRLLKKKSCTYKIFKDLYNRVTPPIRNSKTISLQDNFIFDITNNDGLNSLIKSDYLYLNENDTNAYPSKLYLIIQVNLVVFHCENLNYNSLFNIDDNLYIYGSETWCFNQKVNSNINNFYLLHDSLNIKGVSEEALNLSDIRLKKFKNNTFWISEFE